MIVDNKIDKVTETEHSESIKNESWVAVVIIRWKLRKKEKLLWEEEVY
jgi:hypothetical protein